MEGESNYKHTEGPKVREKNLSDELDKVFKRKLEVEEKIAHLEQQLDDAEQEFNRLLAEEAMIKQRIDEIDMAN